MIPRFQGADLGVDGRLDSGRHRDAARHLPALHAGETTITQVRRKAVNQNAALREARKSMWPSAVAGRHRESGDCWCSPPTRCCMACLARLHRFGRTAGDHAGAWPGSARSSIGLLASPPSSTSAGTAAGSEIMHGLLHVNARCGLPRGHAGAALIVLRWFAKDPTQALVIGGGAFNRHPVRRDSADAYTRDKELMGRGLMEPSST